MTASLMQVASERRSTEYVLVYSTSPWPPVSVSELGVSDELLRTIDPHFQEGWIDDTPNPAPIEIEILMGALDPNSEFSWLEVYPFSDPDPDKLFSGSNGNIRGVPVA